MAASTEMLPDILSEGWVWWLPDKELKKTKFGPQSDGWKSYYFYMTCSLSNCANVALYKKAPRTKKDKPHVTHTYRQYQLHKLSKANEKRSWICEVINEKRQSAYYAFENEARRDSFAFFMITQRCLPTTPASGRVFSVDPDDSDSQRKIGARGSACLIHICKSGVTLAFKSSQSIVAQWPLNCVRNYESSGSGCFQIEAGRRAPMGEGLYRFLTETGVDSDMYSLFDRFVNETLEETGRSQKPQKSREDKIYDEYTNLRTLADDKSTSKHSSVTLREHLRRISANNFSTGEDVDQLSVCLPEPPQTDVRASVEGNHRTSTASNTSANNGLLPDSKLSDVEQWMQEKPSRSHKLPNNSDSTPPKLPVSAKPTSLRRPDKLKQTLPLTPSHSSHSNNMSPSNAKPNTANISTHRHIPLNIVRQRSKTSTEDPLSLPSLGENQEYMPMAASMQSLNIIHNSPTTRSSTNRNPPFSSPTNHSKSPTSRSHKSLAQLSMSTSSVSRSFDTDGSARIPRRMDSQSPTMSAFSPLSLATPPPSFYEAMGLPPYIAPTPPEESVILRNNRLSQQSRRSAESTNTDSGENTLPLPPKNKALRLRSQSTQSSNGVRSAQSCEDLTQLVRGSLILSPSFDDNEYENAMFNNELLQSMERSTDLTLAQPAVYKQGPSKVKAIQRLSEETGNTNQVKRSSETLSDSYTVSDSTATRHDRTLPCVRDDKTPPTEDHQEYNDDLQEYHLASDVMDPLPESPRVSSTYLYEKAEDIPARYDNNMSDSHSDAGPRRRPPLIQAYCTTTLNGETNNFTIESTSPPPIPNVPRPIHILRDDTSTPNLRNKDQYKNTADTVSNRDTLAYEPVDYTGVASRPPQSTSTTLSSTGRSGPDVYERVDVEKMLENQKRNKNRQTSIDSVPAVREATTTWHIPLADDFSSHHLPNDVSSTQSQAIPTNAEGREADQPISGREELLGANASWTEDPHGYLMPVSPPRDHIILPLPPPETGEESEEEAGMWSAGFGTIRRMFSEISRSKMRRSKSTDVLSISTIQETSTNKPSVKPASHNIQTTAQTRRKSKNKSASSKANGEFSFIKASPSTKEYRKSDS